MMLIQISPSLLETYRQVLAGEYGQDASRIREYITRKYEINQYSSRGWAYHKLLEDGPDQYRKLKPVSGKVQAYYEVEDWRVKRSPWTGDFNPVWAFSESAVEPAFKLQELYGSGIPEAWVDWLTYSNGLEVRVRQRTDLLYGQEIHEFKTSKSSGDYARYFKSLQWRCNLMAIPDATGVTYHHIQFGAGQKWARLSSFTYDRSLLDEAELKTYVDGLVSWLQANPDLLERLVREGDNAPFAGVFD